MYKIRRLILELVKEQFLILLQDNCICNFGLCYTSRTLLEKGYISLADYKWFKKYLVNHRPKNRYTKIYSREIDPSNYSFWDIRDSQSRLDWLDRHINRLDKLNDKNKFQLFFIRLWELITGKVCSG